MKSLMMELRTAVVATVILLLLVCGVYPAVVFGLAQALFPQKANGSLILDASGAVRGSALLGQNFSGPGYFHPRPSAAGAHGYDGAASGGSNLGPTSKALQALVAERVATYREVNSVQPDETIPADAVTASASGLDPHISVRNAEIQARRVAKRRGIDEAWIHDLVAKHTEGKGILRFLGDPGVNVLRLNLALDDRKERGPISREGSP
jgi:K+-transporting ATPase ATPase C chain